MMRMLVSKRRLNLPRSFRRSAPKSDSSNDSPRWRPSWITVQRWRPMREKGERRSSASVAPFGVETA